VLLTSLVHCGQFVTLQSIDATCYGTSGIDPDSSDSPGHDWNGPMVGKTLLVSEIFADPSALLPVGAYSFFHKFGTAIERNQPKDCQRP